MNLFAENEIRYIIGRSNLALTVFVPYDCPNHCPFCTSKSEYASLDKNKQETYLNNIFNSIHMCLALRPITDVVITGGEPFANLEYLQRILDYLEPFPQKVYINTTLPVKDEEEKEKILNFIIKNKHKIDGLNVSRHMCLRTKLEDDTLLEQIKSTTRIPIKINSVLLGVEAEKDKVLDFIKKYAPIAWNISFRGDYTKVKNQDDLRTLEHPLLNVLFNLKELEYLSSGGCLVCNNNDFWYDKNVVVSLHRGYEHSLVIKANNFIINDIIIKQNGDAFLDWDSHPLNKEVIEEIKKQWRR